MSRTIACRVSEGEWLAFQEVCRKHHVNYQAMFHSIIIDALVEEGFDALRRREPERREGGGETGEAGGATTP